MPDDYTYNIIEELFLSLDVYTNNLYIIYNYMFSVDNPNAKGIALNYIKIKSR